MNTDVHFNCTPNTLNPTSAGGKDGYFLQTADITQACFLSGMFYFTFLLNCRLDKRGSNLHQGSEYEASGVKRHSPPSFLHSAPGRVPRHSIAPMMALSSLPSVLKERGAKAFCHVSSPGHLTDEQKDGACSSFLTRQGSRSKPTAGPARRSFQPGCPATRLENSKQ